MVLDTIQRVLAVIAPLSIVIGVIIALLQLRTQQSVRQMETVMRLYSTFGEEQFQRHYRRVATWPYKTYAEYRQQDSAEDYISLMVVSVFFENMGLLLKRGLAPIDLLDDLLSGPLLEIWPKVQPIWVGLREEYSMPAWSEWFEYFHDAIARRLEPLRKRSSPMKRVTAG